MGQRNPGGVEKKDVWDFSEVRKQDHYKLEVRKMQLTELGDTKNGTIYPEIANPATGESTIHRYL